MPYSGDPSASAVDAVRFWVQDTGKPPLLSDTEIEYLIAFSGVDAAGAPIQVAVLAANQIAAKYAGEVSISADGVNYSGDQLAQKYTALASQLRNADNQRRAYGAAPYVGGILTGEAPPWGTNPPQFGIGKDDNPEVGYQGYGWNGDDGAHENTGQVGH